ncbi:MAG: ABC transporter permease [Thermoanaerobaculia bacterium]
MKRQLFLLTELVKRDFQGRYAGSLLGFLWPFLLPVWQLVLFTFVFSTVMKISLVGERTGSFGIFLFAGLLPWMAVNEGVTRSATAVTDNADLVRHSSFRSEVLVLTVVLGGVIQQVIAAAVFTAILAFRGELTPGSLPLLLVALPLQVAITLGLGLIVCCVHTIFRDVAQVVGLVMMGWFYLTPIVYPLSLVPEDFQGWLRWNPLTALVGLYRQAFLGGSGDWLEGALWLTVVAAVLLGAGLGLFRRLQSTFADEI